MAMLFDPKRIKKIKKTIKGSRTEIQFETRKDIAKRLLKYIDESKQDEEFYAKAWNDFPVWSIAFIDDDSGNPLFPAKWQIEYARKMAQKKYVWAMCSRKVGKSTLLAVKNLHDMCGLVPKRVVCFAPTLKQDFVFEKMLKYIGNSDYLRETFVGQKGSLTKDYIDLMNASSCQNKTIGLATKGELTRGEYGDIVTVDEVQKIESSVMRQVIFPIIADAYSEKNFRMLGTPNLFTNPNLEKEWRQWKRDSQLLDAEYDFMWVDWKRGVAEGCLDEKYVLAEKERMTPDEFAMEYEALFPEQGTRFFDINLLETCGDDASSFTNSKNGGCAYGIAIDWAAYMNRTQILVGELNKETKTLKYIAWKEIDPKRNRIDYENQVDLVKAMFYNYNCEWICPDATSNQDAIVRMLLTGKNSIPEGFFYKTGDRTGYIATDVSNDQMWRNHKQQMVKGRVKAPLNGSVEKRFFEVWKKEHNELDVKMIRNGQMVKLEEPKNGYKDLAITSAMLSLMIQVYDRGTAFFGLDGW